MHTELNKVKEICVRHFHTQMGGTSTQTQTYTGRWSGVRLQCWLEALPDRPAQLYKPHRRRVRKQQSKLATHRHALTQRGGCAHTDRFYSHGTLTRHIVGGLQAKAHPHTHTHLTSHHIGYWGGGRQAIFNLALRHLHLFPCFSPHRHKWWIENYNDKVYFFFFLRVR